MAPWSDRVPHVLLIWIFDTCPLSGPRLVQPSRIPLSSSCFQLFPCGAQPRELESTFTDTPRDAAAPPVYCVSAGRTTPSRPPFSGCLHSDAMLRQPELNASVDSTSQAPVEKRTVRRSTCTLSAKCSQNLTLHLTFEHSTCSIAAKGSPRANEIRSSPHV